jgi:hypothetical protein
MPVSVPSEVFSSAQNKTSPWETVTDDGKVEELPGKPVGLWESKAYKRLGVMFWPDYWCAPFLLLLLSALTLSLPQAYANRQPYLGSDRCSLSRRIRAGGGSDPHRQEQAPGRSSSRRVDDGQLEVQILVQVRLRLSLSFPHCRLTTRTCSVSPCSLFASAGVFPVATSASALSLATP